MRFFYDTEFHEDGKTIDLISIGIVAEDGREYYAISSEFNTRRVAQNDWLMDNVMSSIEHDVFMVSDSGTTVVQDIYVLSGKPRAQIAKEITEFIGNDPAPELWAWYGAYDHVCLAQLFGAMINLPSNIPMYTNDLKTMEQEAGKKAGRPIYLLSQPIGVHNALDDARWNKVRYDHLREFLNV